MYFTPLCWCVPYAGTVLLFTRMVVNVFVAVVALVTMLVVLDLTYQVTQQKRESLFHQLEGEELQGGYSTKQESASKHSSLPSKKREVVRELPTYEIEPAEAEPLPEGKLRVRKNLPKLSPAEPIKPVSAQSTIQVSVGKGSPKVKSYIPCGIKTPIGCVTNNPSGSRPVHLLSRYLHLSERRRPQCSDRACTEHLTEQDKDRNRTCWNNMQRQRKPIFRPNQFDCHFVNRTGRSPVALVSFPGSGSNWVRGLLEQVTGMCTGSIYCEPDMLEKGFYEDIRSSSVLVVKIHTPAALWDDNPSTHLPAYFGGAVAVIRNPFDALVAERHRVLSGNLGSAGRMQANTKWFGM